MKKIYLAMTMFAVTALGSTSLSLAQTTNWKLDASHSQVKFSVVHMMISEVEGTFKKFDGKFASNGNDFSKSTIEFTIDVASIFTNDEKRDAHLKSDDFFNAEKFPTMKFVGTSMTKIDEKNYTLDGKLTIRNVTKPIKLKVVAGGMAKDPWGNTRSAFNVTGIVNRLDYGLTWNMLLETGGAIVSSEVNFNVSLELIQQK